MIELLKITEENQKYIEQGVPPLETDGLFGLNLSEAEASLVLLPVPWEPTTSYGKGTACAPDGVRLASHQLDLEDPEFGALYSYGFMLDTKCDGIEALNAKACEAAKRDDINQVNKLSLQMNRIVYERAKALFQKEQPRMQNEKSQKGRLVGVLGGDHSSPLGLIQAIGEIYTEGFGILHIDAHHDLRDAYQGFEFSHASIMHQVLTKVSAVSKLVQVGIRDFSKDEKNYASAHPKVHVFYDLDLAKERLQGKSFEKIAKDIVSQLPQNVYISFDIDGLEPSLCPHTGTPVPGGLGYHEAQFLLGELVRAKKTIVGFDLCEVSQGGSNKDWDFNVGARILYKLCCVSVASHLTK